MSAQAVAGPTAGREEDVNVVRSGGSPVGAARGGRAPQRGHDVHVPGGRRATRGPPVPAARRCAGVHRVVASGAALRDGVAARRRRRGRGRHPAGASSGAGGCRLAGRGGGQLRSAGAACSERMSTPRLGLGWKDVAFSGSRRPRLMTRTTSAKSGAGSSTPTVGGPARARASSTLWWYATCGGRQGRDEVPVQPLHRQQPPIRDVDRRPGVAVGRGEGPGGQGDERRTGLAGSSWSHPRPVRRRSRSSSPTPRSVRWIAPRKSPVSPWSTSMASPLSQAGAGVAPAGAGGRRRTGGGRRR